VTKAMVKGWRKLFLCGNSDPWCPSFIARRWVFLSSYGWIFTKRYSYTC